MSISTPGILKAYREILKREPDQEGLEFWNNRKVSFPQLCSHLRSSFEYKRKFTRDVFCETNKNFLEWPKRQYFYISNHNILYCPIAKNACTTLKRLMVKISDIASKKEILTGDVHKLTDSKNSGIQLGDLDLDTVDYIFQKMKSSNHFSFAVLREPKSRLLSAYWEKFVLGRMSLNNLYHTKPVLKSVYRKQNLSRSDIQSGITFEQFVEYITNSDPYELDTHWIPQNIYLKEHTFNAFYNIQNLKPLYKELSTITATKLIPEHENATNSGCGNYLKNAFQMYPQQLVDYKPISIESFFNSSLESKVLKYFSKDIHLMENCD